MSSIITTYTPSYTTIAHVQQWRNVRFNKHTSGIGNRMGGAIPVSSFVVQHNRRVGNSRTGKTATSYSYYRLLYLDDSVSACVRNTQPACAVLRQVWAWPSSR